MEKKLKILVIDDNPLNLEVAKMQLAEHELVLCSSFREAMSALNNDPIDHAIDEKDKERAAIDDAGFRLKNLNSRQQFDVILTDLFLPTCLTGLWKSFYKNGDYEKEQPYGLAIVLIAMRRGIKKIALVTNANHHAHPIIYALDPLCMTRSYPICLDDTTFVYSIDQLYKLYDNWEDSWTEKYPNQVQAKSWLPAMDLLFKL